MTTRQTLLLIGVTALLLCGACGSSPATRFYVLDSTAAPGAAIDLTVGLGPVQLPPYVDHDGVATRNGPTSLSLAEFDQWAEPLQDGFERVLLQDLSVSLGSTHVELHPWGATDVDVRVPVRVLRFDNDAAGAATLVARWAVLTADQDLVSPARISEITVPGEGSDFADATDALAHAVGRLAAEIAAELRAQTGNVD